MKLEFPSERRYRLFVLLAAPTLALAALAAYLLIDQPVAAWVGAHPCQWDKVAPIRALRQMGKGWVAIWVLVLWGWRARRPEALMTGLVALLIGACLWMPVRQSVQRYRPGATAQTMQAKYGSPSWLSNWSFPSADSGVAFTTAATVAWFIRPAWWEVPFLLAAGVAAMRVITYAHYPADVLGGATLGVVAAWAGLWLTPRLVRRLASRPPPLWLGRLAQKPWLRWRGWPGVVLVLMALPELLAGDGSLYTFVTLVGPPMAVFLLVAEAWAWLKRRRGTQQPA